MAKLPPLPVAGPPQPRTVAGPPQPQMAGSTQLPTRGPPAPLPGPASWGQRPTSPPPGWQHLPPSSPPPPPLPAPGGTAPSPHRSPGEDVDLYGMLLPPGTPGGHLPPLLGLLTHCIIEGPTGPTSAGAGAPGSPTLLAAGGCAPYTPCSYCTCSSSSSSSGPSSNLFSSSSTVGYPPPSSSSCIVFGTGSSSKSNSWGSSKVTGSPLRMQALGTTSPSYQLPPWPPQLAQGHPTVPSMHGTKLRAVGRGMT